MSLFGLVFIMFVVALPAMGLLSAVQMLPWSPRSAPALPRSRSRALAAKRSVRRESLGFRETRDARWVGLLDETALFPRTRMARYFAAQHRGRTILLRAQPELVNQDGHPVGSRAARDDCEVERVIATWTILLDARIPADLQLLCVLGPEDDVLGDCALAAGLIHGALLELVGPGDQLVVSEGHIGFASPFAAGDRLTRQLIHELLHLADRLARASQSRPIDVVSLLVELIETDASSEARSRAVQSILQRFPDDPRVAHIRQRAKTDPHPAVRFACARHLGQEGLDVAEQVIFQVDAAEGLRQRALRHLIREAPRARTLRVLRRVLGVQEDRLRQIAIRHLGTLQHEPALEWFASMPLICGPSLGLELVQAVRAIGSARGEELLRPHLLWNDVSVQIATIEAFALIGTQRAMPVLSHFARHAISREVRRAAANAAREVRSRHRGAGPGALSMPKSSGQGELSLARTQRGALAENRAWRRRRHSTAPEPVARRHGR